MKDLENFTEFYALYNSEHFKERLTSISSSSKLPEEKVSELKKTIERRISQLKALKDYVKQITPLIGNKMANDLLISIDANIESLEVTDKTLKGMMDSITADGFDLLKENVNTLNDKMFELDNIVAKIDSNFEDSLYYSVVSGAVTIDELESMKNKPGLSDEKIDMIEKTVERLTKEKEQTAEAEDQAEQQAVEDEKGNESETTDEVVEETIAVPSVSDGDAVTETVVDELQRRLDQIVYQPGMNYAQTVAYVRAEYELEQLDKQIEALKGKEKLSFKESVLLNQLVNQSTDLMLMLQAMNLSRKEQRREGQIFDVNQRLDEQNARIQREQEQRETYQSRTLQFISLAREHRLTARMEQIQAHMTRIQSNQRTSSLLAFDKQYKRLIRKSRRKARGQVVTQRATEAIEELRALRNDVVNEINNVRADVERFIHRPELVDHLREKPVTLNAQPVPIMLPEVDELEATIARAA